MKRIRVIGLICMIVWALSAIVAASAAAQLYEFSAEAYPVEVRGHSSTPQEFGFATCTEATFNTNEEGAPNPTKESSTLLVHPRYRECRTTLAAGSFPDEVRTEGCNYRFHAAPPNTR